MALYINQTGKLKEVKEEPFKLEKDIDIGKTGELGIGDTYIIIEPQYRN